MPPRHAIKDADWERIKDHLPGQPGQHGKAAKNNRLLLMPSFGSPRPVPRRATCPNTSATGKRLAAARPLGQQADRAKGSGSVFRHPPRPGFGVGDLGLHRHPGPSPRCGR